MSTKSTTARGEELVAGKYRLVGNLGIGGMGRVDAAVNIYSGQRVALKRISAACMTPQRPGSQPDAAPPERRALMDRLLKESKALARLDHVYIVRLLDCGLTETCDLYIAMELVEGEPLRALIRSAVKQGKRLELDLVLRVGAAVAEAMEFAHRKEICHRDLKPENIIVERGGSAKVVDFGLAKLSVTALPPIGGDHQSNPANVVGTPLYMAPEQVRGLEVGPGADIYALGVTLYESITLRTPYDTHEDGATVTDLMAHHVYAEPTPIRNHAPECPERLIYIINRCLAKSPADRYPHMGSLARDLRGALEEVVLRQAARSGAAKAAAGETAPREVRVTEPMPEPVQRVASLPFVAAVAAPEPPRELRVTEPMPEPSSPPRPVLPFTVAGMQALLAAGVDLVRTSDPAATPETGEETISRSAIPPPPSVPPPGSATTEIHLVSGAVSRADPDEEVTLKRSDGPLAPPLPGSPPSASSTASDSYGDAAPPAFDPETPVPISIELTLGDGDTVTTAAPVTTATRESGGAGPRSSPDFAFESPLSEASREPAVQTAPHPTPLPLPRPNRHKLTAYAAALLVGLSLAVSGMLVVMKLHDGPGHRSGKQSSPSTVSSSASVATPSPSPTSTASVSEPTGSTEPAVETRATATPASTSSAVIVAVSKSPQPAPSPAPLADRPRPASTPRVPKVAPTASSAPPAPPPPPPPPASTAPNRLFGVDQ